MVQRNGKRFQSVHRQSSPKDQAVVDHVYLVEIVARKVKKTLPSHAEVDDLVSAGIVGLMDAVVKFDSSRDASFKTYASVRIHGAIMDELRRLDLLPRSMRAKGRHLRQVISILQQQLQREPTEAEVATAAYKDVQDVRKTLQGIVAGSANAFVSMDAENSELPKTLSDENINVEHTGPYVPGALGRLMSADTRAELVRAISTLDDLSAAITREFYFEEKSLADIALAHKLSEEKVRRLLHIAHGMLRQMLRSQGFDEAG
jgi:RNA polymerase sigma factor for flagellar operon FliA